MIVQRPLSFGGGSTCDNNEVVAGFAKQIGKTRTKPGIWVKLRGATIF